MVIRVGESVTPYPGHVYLRNGRAVAPRCGRGYDIGIVQVLDKLQGRSEIGIHREYDTDLELTMDSETDIVNRESYVNAFLSPMRVFRA